MVQPTIFQHPLFTDFILPFLLIFVVLFGILQKTQIFGEGKKQIDALTSFVIALIFVSLGYFVPIINGLILYFSVAIVIILIFMIMYGFVSADSKDGFKPEKWMKWVFGILAGVSLVAAVLYVTGSLFDSINFLFYSSWSPAFWANALFIVIIAGAIALVLRSPKGGK